MISEKDLQLIEDFLHQNLSSADREEVEKRIANDPLFKTHLQIVRDLPSAVAVDTEGFKQDLEKVMQSEGSSSGKIRRLPLRRIMLAVAATVAIVLAINFLVQDASPDQLFAQHFQMPPENISVRSDAAVDESLTTALEAYSTNNHEIAASNFEQFLEEHPDEQAARFFYSLSLMAQEQHATAEENLLKLTTEESMYRTSAQWYLGLLYLKLQNQDQASNYLKELAAGQSSYQQRAKDILDEL
ncbi:MAG: hypothetical protein HKN87_16235 [Saprospiraceae bacterium]|nr:hypothetical protein [Saprospiraceae bacterium]